MIPAAGLLRLLAGAPARPAPTQAPAAPGSADFASLLEKARAGEVASGRAVTIHSDAKVSLTPEQLERLSIAADRAEAEGATRAIVLIDGKAVRLDVTMREITGAIDLKNPAVLTGIDAVITTPPAPTSASPGSNGQQDGASANPPDGPLTPLPSPPASWSNASLLKSLAAAGQ